MIIPVARAAHQERIQMYRVQHLAVIANVVRKVISYKLNVKYAPQALIHPLERALVNFVQKINIHLILDHVSVIAAGQVPKSTRTRLDVYYANLDSFQMMKVHANNVPKVNIQQHQVRHLV